MESRVALLTPLTWITVLVMLPHPSVNGTSEEFISAFSTCGVRVCVCSGSISILVYLYVYTFRTVTSVPSGR